MTSFVVDIKSRDVCIDVIRKYIRKQSTESNCILILAKYHHDYHPYINEYLPFVLANIVVEYSHEIYNIDCVIKQTIPQYYVVTLTNKKIFIDNNIFLRHDKTIFMYDYAINNISSLKNALQIKLIKLFVDYFAYHANADAVSIK